MRAATERNIHDNSDRWPQAENDHVRSLVLKGSAVRISAAQSSDLPIIRPLLFDFLGRATLVDIGQSA